MKLSKLEIACQELITEIQTYQKADSNFGVGDCMGIGIVFVQKYGDLCNEDESGFIQSVCGAGSYEETQQWLDKLDLSSSPVAEFARFMVENLTDETGGKVLLIKE
jgi:hypothetical protein